jgi:hypothetical protein
MFINFTTFEVYFNDLKPFITYDEESFHIFGDSQYICFPSSHAFYYATRIDFYIDRLPSTLIINLKAQVQKIPEIFFILIHILGKHFLIQLL